MRRCVCQNIYVRICLPFSEVWRGGIKRVVFFCIKGCHTRTANNLVSSLRRSSPNSFLYYNSNSTFGIVSVVGKQIWSVIHFICGAASKNVPLPICSTESACRNSDSWQTMYNFWSTVVFIFQAMLGEFLSRYCYQFFGRCVFAGCPS